MLDTILNSIVPVFFVIALGWFSGKKEIVSIDHKKAFADYVMMFSFPLHLFIGSAKANPKTLLDVKVISAFTLALMGLYIISFIIQKYIFKYDSRKAAQGSIVCAFPNMAFMGIPVLTSLIGPEALISVAIGNIITSIFMIPITTIILESKEDSASPIEVIKTSLINCIKKPLIIAPILGVLCSVFQIEIPKAVFQSCELIGKSTSGVSLFSLGLIMASYRIVLSGQVFFNIFMKNILQPVIMVGLIILFNLKGVMAKEILLLCSMPTATISTMFGLKYGVSEVESSSSTILGTIFSIITLSFLISFIFKM
ncbi:MAG: AEC family transporter [Fusobacteriaceae bacterium]